MSSQKWFPVAITANQTHAGQSSQRVFDHHRRHTRNMLRPTISASAACRLGIAAYGFAANPYAAMPSLHAADALIVGISMAGVCRHWWSKTIWLLWPAWVWFAVMATGNHFWLDILAGIVVALIAGVVVYRKPILRRLRPASSPAAA